MFELFKQTVVSQYEAALAMLAQCIAACPPEHWDDIIATATFRWNAYHALFFTDLYLSPSEHDFQLRDFHHRGGDEREDKLSTGLSKEETLAYVEICRQKIYDALAAETIETLPGPSGFSWKKCSRAEHHLANIRHIQHHAAQLSAHLRRVDKNLSDYRALPWFNSGWH